MPSFDDDIARLWLVEVNERKTLGESCLLMSENHAAQDKVRVDCLLRQLDAFLLCLVNVPFLDFFSVKLVVHKDRINLLNQVLL